MRSTSTVLSTSGKLSATTGEGADELSSAPEVPPCRAFKEPVKGRFFDLNDRSSSVCVELIMVSYDINIFWKYT